MNAFAGTKRRLLVPRSASGKWDKAFPVRPHHSAGRRTGYRQALAGTMNMRLLQGLHMAEEGAATHAQQGPITGTRPSKGRGTEAVGV